MAQDDLGTLVDAAQATQGALGDAPPSAAAAIELAKAAMTDRRWDRACEHWAHARAADPDDPIGYNQGAVALRNAGRFGESDALVRTAIGRFGLKPGHLVTLGDTAMDRRDWAGALARWATLRARFADVAQGYYRAMFALCEMRLVEEADFLGRLALRRMPNDARVLAAFAETQRRHG